MIIGVPREIKNSEFRIGLVPAGVRAFVDAGHQVLVEAGAGLGAGVKDEEFEEAGARLVLSARELFGKAGMIVKVTEPTEREYELIRPGQILYSFFNLAVNERLTQAMLDSGCICIACETMTPDGQALPCLIPISEVAGRMAVREGAKYLADPLEGRGILLGGVTGVDPGHVVIIGAGVVGKAAAEAAAGLGANVTLLDINLDRLRYLADVMPQKVATVFSNRHNILEALGTADLLIGAAALPGKPAPRLVTRADLSIMQQGAVIVDIAVDRGGCVETTKPTTHEDPTCIVDGIVHYGVPNMAGAVGRTSTLALTNVTTEFALEIAGRGWKESAANSPAIMTGLSIVEGKCVRQAIADNFESIPYTPIEEVLA